jgi:glycosyltransferase involved in cell wall biosynthesis
MVAPGWPDRARLASLPIESVPVGSRNEWDPIARYRLRAALKACAPAVAFTIGRRATVLTRGALGRTSMVPLVARTPNDRVSRLTGIDHVIATTPEIAQALIAAGQPPERISVIPHLVRVPKGRPRRNRTAHETLVIGALGRLVPGKGFDDLIDALALLRTRGVAFAATLGGAGPEEGGLRRRAAAAALGDRLALPGWVTDKAAFFGGIDLLCVPSRAEAFGLVVLEGMAHGVPVVAADAEGPRAIISDGIDGLLVPRGAPAHLADALERLLNDAALRRRLAGSALETVRTRYALPVVATQLSDTLRSVVRRHATVLRRAGR